jgi:hypothetical protein
VESAAFFDLDKTVITKASVAAFSGHFRRDGLINRRTVVRAIGSQFLYVQLGTGEERMAKIRESCGKSCARPSSRPWSRSSTRKPSS